MCSAVADGCGARPMRAACGSAVRPRLRKCKLLRMLSTRLESNADLGHRLLGEHSTIRLAWPVARGVTPSKGLVPF